MAFLRSNWCFPVLDSVEMTEPKKEIALSQKVNETMHRNFHVPARGKWKCNPRKGRARASARGEGGKEVGDKVRAGPCQTDPDTNLLDT